MKTRKWQILISIMILFIALTSCAGQTEEEFVTIDVWYVADPGMNWVEDVAVPEFEAANENIKVNLVAYPEEEYGLKIETSFAAKEAPDVALLVLFNSPRVAPAGGLLDLTPFMEQDNLSTNDFCPSIYSRFNFLGDKMYALPMDTNIWAMMVNYDLFTDVGLPILTENTYITYNQWLDYSREITKPSDNLEEFIWGSSFFWPRWNSMNNYMSDPFFLGDDGRTCEGNANTQDWINFYEISLAAYKEGLMPDTYSTVMSTYQTLDLFNQGKLGMVYGTLGQAIQARDMGVNVGLTGQPVISEGWTGNVGSWESSWSIFEDSEHPEEAWAFIRFMAEEGALIVAESGEGLGAAAMPCYLPAQTAFLDASEGDELVSQALTLLGQVQSPPWTVDAWASSTPFEEGWRRITEDEADILTAINDATAECQITTDSLWAEWEAISN